MNSLETIFAMFSIFGVLAFKLMEMRLFALANYIKDKLFQGERDEYRMSGAFFNQAPLIITEFETGK